MNPVEPAFPYIPNSAPTAREAMLAAVEAASTEELFASIPPAQRHRGALDLPGRIPDELTLRKTIEQMLGRNQSCAQALSFLGGGCWNHYVPAVCDEIASRSEFVTAFHGGAPTMRGAFQAQWEFQSLLGELLGLDVVSTTTYDWGAAAATAVMMAARLTGRRRVLIPRAMSPIRRRQLETICGGQLDLVAVGYDERTGALRLDELRAELDARTAAVYVEVPSFLGGLEPEVTTIGERAHAVGAQYVVGVDPSSLGVLAGPGDYGADLVCGELQPLGIHMLYGGGLAGFVAMRDDERTVAECPMPLVSAFPTERPGLHAFEWVNLERTSYHLREQSRDFYGTTQTLWAIVAGVYLALMGPQGMAEMGETIMERVAYAADELSRLDGVVGSRFAGPAFKEIVVDFERTGRTVSEINGALREHGIFGGHDLSADFPELGQSALYCVTEVHGKDDLDRLTTTLAEVLA